MQERIRESLIELVSELVRDLYTCILHRRRRFTFDCVYLYLYVHLPRSMSVLGTTHIEKKSCVTFFRFPQSTSKLLNHS